METTSTMNFLKERDFGQTLNATFHFYKENWKGLMTALIYYCLPFAVISVASIFYLGLLDFMQDMRNSSGMPDFASFLPKLGLLMIFGGAFMITLSGTVYSYCSLYHERGGNNFTTKEVGNRLLSTIWVYIKTFFFLAVAMSVVFGLLGLLMFSMGAGGALFLGLLWIALFVYIVVCLFSIFIVQVIEKRGLFDGLSRSFSIIKGNWWRTFGILFVIVLILGVIGSIPQLILQSIMGVSTFNALSPETTADSMRAYLVANTALSTVIRLIIGPIMIIAFVFHYFSLVERKEKTSLLSDAGNIGNNDNSSNPYSGQEESY